MIKQVCHILKVMLYVPLTVVLILLPVLSSCTPEHRSGRPNILFVISDDQSYPHASAYGYEGINTPAFDRVAHQGILFTNAYAQASGCSPSRASILTGKQIWELEEAGSHAAGFHPKFKSYPELLAKQGYAIGYTGKGWSPGDWEVLGRNQNPAGPVYNELKMVSPDGTSFIDYYRNFRDFIAQNDPDKPFCFWLGVHEPHRVYRHGIGISRGLDTAAIKLPPFLPNVPEVKTDIADYLLEIMWYDQQLGYVLDLLEDRGLVENTLVVVTSDQGMPFPRAKANLYEYGTHVPMAAMWPAKLQPRVENKPIGLNSWMPTFLEVAGLDLDEVEKDLGYSISVKSIWTLLEDGRNEAVFAGRERHSSARWNNLPYPSRSIRKDDYLLLLNYKPERWPVGAPSSIVNDNSVNAWRWPIGVPFWFEAGDESLCDGFDDVDNSASLAYLLKHQQEPNIKPYVAAFADKRPFIELYNVVTDPGCLNNLAENTEFAAVRNRLEKELVAYLRQTNDLRQSGSTYFDTVPYRKGTIRQYPVPDWKIK